MAVKVKIKNLNDVNKVFDQYLKETNQTAEDFVKEKARIACARFHKFALPKKAEDGKRMINKDVANTVKGVKRILQMMDAKRKYLTKYILKLWSSNEIEKINEVLRDANLDFQLRTVTEQDHKNNWSHGKTINQNPNIGPSNHKQIRQIQKSMQAKVGIGKLPWLLAINKLGGNKKVAKKFSGKQVDPIIKEDRSKGFRLVITNPIDYASHILSKFDHNSALNAASRGIMAKWKRAMEELSKKHSR